MPSKFAKVYLLGSSGVGKSAFTLRIFAQEFRSEYDPSCEDYYGLKLAVDDKEIKYILFDPKGTDRTSLTDLFLNEADGYLIAYSIASKESFEKAKYLYSTIAPEYREKVILIGTKSDLAEQRQVTLEEAKAVADSWRVSFFETSAKKAENITQPFLEIGRAYIKAFGSLQTPIINEARSEGINKSKEIVVQVQKKDYLVQVPDGSIDPTQSFTVQVKQSPSDKPQAYTVQVQDGSVKFKAQDSVKVEGSVRENVADKRLDTFELDVNDITIQGVDERGKNCCVAL